MVDAGTQYLRYQLIELFLIGCGLSVRRVKAPSVMLFSWEGVWLSKEDSRKMLRRARRVPGD